MTTATPATLGQNSNSEHVLISLESNKTLSNITYERDKSDNYANTTTFANCTDSEELLKTWQ